MSNKYIDGMPNEEYHAAKAISKSTLDMASKDPLGPIWARECPPDKEKLKTFDFGDAMHAICLEPERLKSEFVTMPKFDLRTNKGKEAKTEFEAENTSSKILSHDDMKKLNLMFESVMAHPQARELIERDGVAERSYFWQDDQTGLDCKCRPDKLILEDNLLIDVKTAPDLNKFCFSVDEYRYHIQDAWYCDGVGKFYDNAMRMEFLVIQKTIEIGRYPVRVVKLPPEAIEYGRLQYRDELNRYAEFLSRDTAPETIELPMHHRFMDNAMDRITEVQI